MERPVQASLNAQIYEEACEWFIECRSGDLDAAARSAFDRWLRKSPEHQSAYLEIAAIWNEGPGLDPAKKWDLDTLVTQAAEDSGNVVALAWTPKSSTQPASIPPARDASSTRTTQHRRRRIVALAASVVLAVLLVTLYRSTPSGVYETAVGEQRSLALADLPLACAR